MIDAEVSRDEDIGTVIDQEQRRNRKANGTFQMRGFSLMNNQRQHEGHHDRQDDDDEMRRTPGMEIGRDYLICHVERSRDISKYFRSRQRQTIFRDSSTSVGMTK